MSLDIGAALRDGVERAIAPSGLLLIVVFLGVRGVFAIASDTIYRATLLTLADMEGDLASEIFDLLPGPDATPFALDIGFALAIAFALAVAVGAEAVRIVGVRTLVSDHDSRIPRAFVRRNIGWATLNSFVGSIVVAVLILIGLVFFLVPGIIIAIGFFFVRQVIAVEDANFLDAMAESWAVTAGSRFELFVLAAIVVAITFVAWLLGGLVGPTPVWARVTESAIGAVTTVFGMAVAARAYVQLRGAGDEEDLTHWAELES